MQYIKMQHNQLQNGKLRNRKRKKCTVILIASIRLSIGTLISQPTHSSKIGKTKYNILSDRYNCLPLPRRWGQL